MCAKSATNRRRFRLSDAQLYDILFLQMAGFSNKQISVRLNLPQQTIIRNVGLLRRLVFEAEGFSELIREYFWIDLPEMKKFFLFPETMAISDILNRIQKNEAEANVAFSNALFSCVTSCPMVPEPTELEARYLRKRLIHGHFVYPTHQTVETYEGLNERVLKRKKCKGCILAEHERKFERSSKLTPHQKLFYQDAYSNYWICVIFHTRLFRWRHADGYLYCYLNASIFALWIHRMTLGISFIQKTNATTDEFFYRFYADYTGFINKCLSLIGRRSDFGMRFPVIHSEEAFWKKMEVDGFETG